MRILTVVGARPQFVKAAAVSRRAREAGVEEYLVHTGQHYDAEMSAVFFEELQIPCPDLDLAVGSGRHGAQTARMLPALEEVIIAQAPDWVLVYGDTNSTLAGALAAAKLHVPIAHVEAGLRSFNRRMPEEINRVLTDHASDLLLAPTSAAVENLRREGFAGERVLNVGDVMYEAVVHYGRLADERSTVLSALGLSGADYVLATLHRAENTDSPERLAVALQALNGLAERLPVVLPLHPRTRRAIELAALSDQVLQLVLIEPVGYLDMLALERGAKLVVTDSGGVQKEAFFHGVPCVTLRTETEWVELVERGFNRLIPPLESEPTRAAVLDALEQMSSFDPPAGLYGSGRAADRVVRALETELRRASFA